MTSSSVTAYWAGQCGRPCMGSHKVQGRATVLRLRPYHQGEDAFTGLQPTHGQEEATGWPDTSPDGTWGLASLISSPLLSGFRASLVRRLCQAVPHKHICTRRCYWLPKWIFSAVEWGAFNNSAFIGIFFSRFSLTFLNASVKFEGQSGFRRSEQAVFQSLHKSDSFKQRDTFLRCWGLWNGFCSCKIGNACNNAEISYHNKQGN